MEDQDEGKFTYRQIYDYIKDGKYREGLAKAEKLSLRKRSKFFQVEGTFLYYVGGTYACCLVYITKSCNGPLLTFTVYRKDS